MIFLDSSYLIALVIKKDNYLDRSLKIEPQIENEDKLINNTVFNEVLNSLSHNNSYYAVDDVTDLLFSYDIDVLRRCPIILFLNSY